MICLIAATKEIHSLFNQVQNNITVKPNICLRQHVVFTFGFFQIKFYSPHLLLMHIIQQCRQNSLANYSGSHHKVCKFYIASYDHVLKVNLLLTGGWETKYSFIPVAALGLCWP
jgi:hypothetical protein